MRGHTLTLTIQITFVLLIIANIVHGLADHSLSSHFIETPNITNWGSWGIIENCPSGHFVTAMQLQVEQKEGWKDDTGLNGVRLFCSRLGKAVNIYEENPVAITSSVGPYGAWKGVFRCADSGMDPRTSAAVGFQLRVEPPRASHMDDTGANNFRVFCKDMRGGSESHIEIEGDGTDWGAWTNAQFCREGYALCGVATQVDMGENSRHYDDTGLNNVRGECCRIRFHDEDVTMRHEYEIPNRNEVPIPAEVAKDLFIEMRNQQHTPDISPRNEELSLDEKQGKSTLSEILHLQPTGANGLSPPPPSYHSDQLEEEISRLSQLDLGPPDSTNEVKIISPTSSQDDNRIPVDDAFHFHTIEEVKPIVPPEIIKHIDTDLEENDKHISPNDSVVEVKFFSGSISTSRPPLSDDESQDEIISHQSGSNELLVASGSEGNKHSKRGLLHIVLFLIGSYVFI